MSSQACLAFYKAKGRWADKLIRWSTRSLYSHVEFLENGPPRAEDDFVAVATSSSGRDGGVRRKEITFKSDHWDFVDVPWAPASAVASLMAEMDDPYDYKGILFSQILNLRRQNRRAWFCSELCAHAIELQMPQRFSPGDLLMTVQDMNKVHSS